MLLRQLGSTGKSSRTITRTITQRLSCGRPTLVFNSSPRTSPTFNLLRKMSTTAAHSSPAVSTALSLDHIVLTVKDLDATVRFYEDVLGMTHTSFTSPSSPGVQRHALVFGPQKINLHISGKEFEPKAANVQPGSADLCFLVEERVDQVLKRLGEKGVHVAGGRRGGGEDGREGKAPECVCAGPGWESN